jgi:hypothetical protein
VHIDVDTQLDHSSINRSADEIKREMEKRGDSAGQGWTDGFAKAVERDTNVRKAAEKVGDSLDKLTAAEARRATELAKSKAVNDAVAASEEKLNKQRSLGFSTSAAETEKELTALREKQNEINNRLVISTTEVSRAERDRTRSIREAGDAYRQMGNDGESAMSRLSKLGDLPGVGGAIKWNVGLIGIGTLPAAATAITEVAGAVQQLAGAGLALPGIFAGIASSVGVGMLGMFGMSDALDKISKADLTGTQASVDAANKALDGLSPAGADAVKTVAGLKGTFMDLRNIASENMLDGFSGGLKRLVAADLPAVTRGIDGISRGINQNLTQAMTSLGSGSSQGFLDRIFGNTGDAQRRLTAAIDPAIHAIGTLTAAGSDSLPRLADAVGKVADRFDRFITAADGDGRLKKWIDEGLDGFTSLGNIALNIGKSFTAVTAAAGGGAGLLGTLESATGKLQTFLNSSDGQSKLKQFFADGRDMLGQLKDVATTAGPVLAGVFQAGVSAANSYLPLIKQVLDIINKIPGGAEGVVNAFIAWKTISGIGSLATSLTNVGGLLGGLGPKATAAGGAMSSALTLAGPIAAAVALSIAYDGVLNKINQITGTTIATDLNNRVGPGSAQWWIDEAQGKHPTEAKSAAQSALDAARETARLNGPPPLLPGSISSDTLARKDDMTGVPKSVLTSADVPGVSSYSAPTVTSGGSGKDKTPFIDPSKYMMGDPLAGMPGAVAGADPSKIYDADSKVITATHNLEQGRLALQVLEAKGNATQQELLTAKNNLVEQERALYNAQADDIKARTNQMKQSASDLASIFAPLDQDFGISKGIPGLVENLTRMFGNMALAGAIGSSPSLQTAALSLMSDGSGSRGGGGGGYGMSGSFTGMSGGSPNVNAMLALAQGASGNTKYAAASDLVNGLADCSGSISDLYEVLKTGTSTPARDFTTANFATPAGAAALGFQPGFMPGAFNVGVHQGGPGGGHMAATLPNNVNFEGGGGTGGGAQYGGSASGALDPQFESQYYMPVGGPSSIGPAPLGGGVGAPAAGGGGIPIPDITNPGLYNPATGTYGGPGGAGPLPAIPAGAGGGQGYMGLGGPPPMTTGTPFPAGSGGGGQIGGAALDMATDAGAMALDVMAPGAGEGAKIGIQLAKRAIQYGAQVAGIATSGVMETLLPAGSPLAANSWFSKLAGGLSGARPAKDNLAGKGSAQAAPPMPGAPGASGQPGQGGGDTNISVTNQRATEDGTGRDIQQHLSAQYAQPGPG